MTRNHMIGGTDAATLIGLGHVSPLILYLRLRGEVVDDFSGNAATKAGTLFEEHVACPAVSEQFGISLVRPTPARMTLPDEPRIGASFDFVVAGKAELAEIKLTGSKAMWGEAGEKVPITVGAQVQMQMAVARANKVPVPCEHVFVMFVPGFTMEDFVVQEDVAVGLALLDAARDMIHRVDSGTPPTPGDEADARALFLAKSGKVHVASAEEVALLAQLREIKAAAKECEAQEKLIRDALVPKWGDATEIVDEHGVVRATYRANRSFDEAAFTTAYPAVVSQFQKFDRTLAGKDPFTAKLMSGFLREPVSAADQTRVLKLKDQK